MQTRHIVLAAVSITFGLVLTRALRHHAAPVPARAQINVPAQTIPTTGADVPDGLQDTVKQISDLLEAGKVEDALRQCWAPSNLDGMDRCRGFDKCVELTRNDDKLLPTLKRVLVVGPTRTYRTQEGRHYAVFDENKPRELRTITFAYVNKRWYVF
jgi:hypothetical protein